MRGWKEREARGRARLEQGISPEILANLKLADERLRAERAAAEAFAQDQEQRRREVMCTCPTCGEGRVTVEAAALTIAGTEHYRQRALRPDDRHIAQANAMVPKAVETVAPAPAAVAEPRPIAPKPKPRPVVTPPFLGGDD